MVKKHGIQYRILDKIASTSCMFSYPKEKIMATLCKGWKDVKTFPSLLIQSASNMYSILSLMLSLRAASSAAPLSS